NHPEQHERFPQLQGCDCLGNITAESGAPSWCTGLPGTTACPCPPTAPPSSGTPEPSCSANSPTAPASPKPWPRTCPPAPPPPGGTEPPPWSTWPSRSCWEAATFPRPNVWACTTGPCSAHPPPPPPCAAPWPPSMRRPWPRSPRHGAPSAATCGPCCTCAPAGSPQVSAAGKCLKGWIVLDMDATIITTTSNKEGAAPTFKSSFGFHTPWPPGAPTPASAWPCCALATPEPTPPATTSTCSPRSWT